MGNSVAKDIMFISLGSGRTRVRWVLCTTTKRALPIAKTVGNSSLIGFTNGIATDPNTSVYSRR